MFFIEFFVFRKGILLKTLENLAFTVLFFKLPITLNQRVDLKVALQRKNSTRG